MNLLRKFNEDERSPKRYASSTRHLYQNLGVRENEEQIHERQPGPDR
jgi:hypothetical protein